MNCICISALLHSSPFEQRAVPTFEVLDQDHMALGVGA